MPKNEGLSEAATQNSNPIRRLMERLHSVALPDSLRLVGRSTGQPSGDAYDVALANVKT
jgi:hypothetical protein